MKHLLLTGLISLCFACANESISPEEFGVNATIESGTIYSYRLSTGIPFEGGFSIIEDANHAKRSIIEIDDEGLLYVYEPQSNFKGEERVVIENCVSIGTPECSSVSHTVLRIEVK